MELGVFISMLVIEIRSGDKIINYHRSNPRPRKGGATRLLPSTSLDMGVSIHAPARGRLRAKAYGKEQRSFNSRPHRGATNYRRGDELFFKFQSTLPCGERLYQGQSSHLVPGVSIHAPTRGRPYTFETIVKPYMFQSTPPCRERPQYPKPSVSSYMFQSTPPQGGDLSSHPRSL